MDYLCRIADIRVLCTLPCLLTIQEESEEFLLPLSEGAVLPQADIHFELNMAEVLPALPAGGSWQGDLYLAHIGDTLWVYRRLGSGLPPYLCTRRTMNGNRIDAVYLPGSEGELHYSRNLMDLLQLEILLLQKQALLLHASFIRWQGRGILFSAPSGTGKSTQAELWSRYEDARICNGDRAAIRFHGGCWQAYGLPYAGTSGIYRNESAPLRAIVVLAQGPENEISRLSPREAFRYLYPEFSVHRWDVTFVEQVMLIADQLIQDIPVYRLRCRPDRDAVQTLKNFL